MAVVAFELEHRTILGIENRFLRGARYTTLTPVHRGVVLLADPMFGPRDQAYFSGYDTAKLDSSGGDNVSPTDVEPGSLSPMDEVPYTSRRAYLVKRAHAGATENWVVVTDDAEYVTAQLFADTLAQLPGAVTLDVQGIGCGTFRTVPEVARTGFKVRVAPAHQY